MLPSTSENRVRAVCVTTDVALRKVAQRSLGAAGLEVEVTDSIADAAARQPRVVVVGSETRTAGTTPALIDLAKSARVILVGDSLGDDEVIALVRNSRIDNVVPSVEMLEERDLLAIVRKWLVDDYFGLEKYLPWGAELTQLQVGSYDEKRPCCLSIAGFAERIGARRTMVSRIEVVTDELLMNALYDAPAAFEGLSPQQYAHDHSGAAELLAPAQVRYGSDGRYFAVSVEDAYGLLRKEVLLDHVARARAARGTPKPASRDGSYSGAGLGMYFIMSSVTQLVVNLEVGVRTEVMCFFDLQAGAARARTANALHFFSKNPL